MPELPDLVHIEGRLSSVLPEREVKAVRVFEPVVLRIAVPGGFESALTGRGCTGVRRRGPFLVLGFPPYELIVHFMLAGRFALRAPAGLGADPSASGVCKRRGKSHCFSLYFGKSLELAYLDDRRMGRVYLVTEGQSDGIPGFADQGVEVLSEAFTLAAFRELIRGRRQQVRVFLMDQSALSAIGNAYADEILFAARLHPKTPCHQLSAEDTERLYLSIGRVLREAVATVEAAGRPIEDKVRDHVKVRGRHGSPCPVCGTTIRRTGVRGYDSFFCPSCQPTVRPGFVPWGSAPAGPQRRKPEPGP
ncbi:MAG: hypothetical protein JW820_20475 [Spirochaetales bacterium]|nr:hypothetical protein [Spirochaetales bacterium]